MAYTTYDLQRLFEDAWDAAPDGPGGMRAQLRASEAALSPLLAAGTVTSTASSGRSTALQVDGRVPGSVSTKDMANAWRDLLCIWEDKFRQLSYWFANGLDPKQSELLGQDVLVTTVPNPSDKMVADEDMAEWVMGSTWIQLKGINPRVPNRNWISHLLPVYEYQSDYTFTRFPPTFQSI